MKPQIEPHELMIFGAITAHEAEVKAESKTEDTGYPLEVEDYTPNTREIAKKSVKNFISMKNICGSHKRC